jgi:prepilin-type N-terminal cleavage/methylation domain-containing protein
MLNSRSQRKFAFTLIELLVVIAIIGVLAGLAIYFIPSFQTSERAARGGSNVQQWLQSARQRAKRDGVPRGLRIVFDTTTGHATKAMYLEVPDDLGGGRYYDATAKDWRTLQIVSGGSLQKVLLQSVLPNNTGVVSAFDFGAGFSKDPTVQYGDYLELDGAGLPRVIVDTAQSDNTKPVYDVLVLASQLPEGISSPVKNFRIVRAPRPTGDEVLELPKSIVVDANTNAYYDGKVWGTISLPINLTTGNLDILFSPTGAVMTRHSKPEIRLWVRSTDEDSVPVVQPTDYFRGEPTLIVVGINSGNVSAYHVNVGNPADPYDLIK